VAVAKWNNALLGWSIIGYAIAAIIAVAGFALAFRDLS
jgi:hypothetical protein